MPKELPKSVGRNSEITLPNAMNGLPLFWSNRQMPFLSFF